MPFETAVVADSVSMSIFDDSGALGVHTDTVVT